MPDSTRLTWAASTTAGCRTPAAHCGPTPLPTTRRRRSSRAVFEAGIWQVVQDKWDGIRDAFHGFDLAQVAAMTPAQSAATENDARVIRNKAKIRATVDNAREVQAVLDSYGSIRAYFASFPDAHAASADMQRHFKFLGDSSLAGTHSAESPRSQALGKKGTVIMDLRSLAL
jgi:3-methyladenine DNA glycosylase Tag